MKSVLILAFLNTITTIVADIDIEISIIIDTNTTMANFSGEIQNEFKNLALFGITDDDFSKCLKIYMGKTPDEIYFVNKTPLNLYKKYGWRETRKIVVPKSVEILSMEKESKILRRYFYHNTNDRKFVFNVATCQRVENVVCNLWETIDFEGIVKYDIAITQNCTIKFDYNASFGHNMVLSEPFVLGDGSCVNVDLEPGQLVRAELIAEKTIVELQIQYEAYLSGDVALSYVHAHNSHHFWAPNIDHVLQTCGINNSIVMKENLTISVYSDAKLFVTDLDNGRVIGEYEVPLYLTEVMD